MKDHKIKGTVWLYVAEGVESGQWLLSVKVHHNGRKAVVKVVGSEFTSFKHSQFWGATKTHDFEQAKNKRLLYHMLGISQFEKDERGRARVRSKRKWDEKSLPRQFRRYFRGCIKRHREVSPRTGWTKRGHPLADSLVVQLPKNRPDMIVWSYVLEKLQPLFDDRFVEPRRVTLSFFA